MPSVLQELASWAVATRAVSDASAHASRRVLMDQIGVSLAGEKTLPTVATGTPGARVWSTGETVYAPDAALANRFAGDDLELTAGPEIGATVVAAAEISEKTLGEIWVAMTVAAELEQHVRSWLQLAVEARGLHPPAVFATMGATAAAAKLLALEPDAFTGALASAWALTPLSPYSAFAEGATGKWTYGAWGQRLGLQCALWARAGIAGAATTLEGPRGIARALGCDQPPPAFRPRGEAITNVTFKPYPCSRACHAALTALDALGPVDGTAIERVDIWSYPFSVDLEERSAKSNAISSQMSLSQTLRERLRTQAPITVTREGDETLPRQRRARVKITFANGGVREASSEAKWSMAAPATDEELRDRFNEAAAGRRVLDPWPLSDDTPISEAYGG